MIKKNHRLKIYYNLKGNSYFILNNSRYYLNELPYNRETKRITILATNCCSISYKVDFEYDIEDYIILSDKKEIIL